MDPMLPPVYLVGPDAIDEFPGVSGWSTRLGFDLGDGPWDRAADRILCVGTVDEASAPMALEALARGAALAIHVAVQGTARHRFLDDLHKVGAPVPYEPPTPTAAARLDDTQRALLDALAGGATVTAAAVELHLSRRTANRILADARTQLGAVNTAEAVRRWLDERRS